MQNAKHLPLIPIENSHTDIEDIDLGNEYTQYWQVCFMGGLIEICQPSQTSDPPDR